MGCGSSDCSSFGFISIVESDDIWIARHIFNLIRNISDFNNSTYGEQYRKQMDDILRNILIRNGLSIPENTLRKKVYNKLHKYTGLDNDSSSIVFDYLVEHKCNIRQGGNWKKISFSSVLGYRYGPVYSLKYSHMDDNNYFIDKANRYIKLTVIYHDIHIAFRRFHK